jgi:hypothetical protein
MTARTHLQLDFVLAIFMIRFMENRLDSSIAEKISDC